MANRRPDCSRVGGLEGSFPSGLSNPQGITSHGGALYVVDGGNAIVNYGGLTTRLLQGRRSGRLVPIRSLAPSGITSHGGSLYVLERLGLWRLDDPTVRGRRSLKAHYPSGRVVGPHWHHVVGPVALRGGQRRIMG